MTGKAREGSIAGLCDRRATQHVGKRGRETCVVSRFRATRLRQDGHDVLYIAELSPGIVDEEILSFSNGESRI